MTAAPGNQGRGCTQTNTAAAGGRGGCMCTSIPAQGKKKKGGERAVLILAILLPGKQTLRLGSCLLQNQAQTSPTLRGIRRSHWDVSSLPKIAVAIEGLQVPKKMSTKAAGRTCFARQKIPKDSTWAVVGEQKDGKKAQERQEHY